MHLSRNILFYHGVVEKMLQWCFYEWGYIGHGGINGMRGRSFDTRFFFVFGFTGGIWWSGGMVCRWCDGVDDVMGAVWLCFRH
jgi:hypothetical protein